MLSSRACLHVSVKLKAVAQAHIRLISKPASLEFRKGVNLIEMADHNKGWSRGKSDETLLDPKKLPVFATKWKP